MRIIVFNIIFFLISLWGYSQNDIPVSTQKAIEQNAENSDENSTIDYTNVIEDLSNFELNKIDLNSTTVEELEKLGLLDDVQIANFIKYRIRYGTLISIWEIKSINGFDEEVFNAIQPYIMVKPVELKKELNGKRVFKYGSHQLVTRFQTNIQEQAGYRDRSDSLIQTNKAYLGSPFKIYTKYRFHYKKKITFSLTGEKDAGEQFFKGTQKSGFDFYSASFGIKEVWHFKNIVIGDYTTQFGQGLTLWSGFSIGKGAGISNTRKFGAGFKSYSGVDENKFFRGAATTFSIKKFDFSLFFSSKKIDGNLNSDTLYDYENLSGNFVESGYHYTMNEMNKKDQIREAVYGGNISFKTQHFRLGFTAYHNKYDVAISQNQVYNAFAFSGRENSVMGFDYVYVNAPFTLFGECSRSENGGMAYLNGIAAHLSPFLQFSALQRYYEKDFQNLYAAPFGANSIVGNESGYYIGIVAKPIAKWGISAYTDIYRFPWLKYRTNAPSGGDENYVELMHTYSRRLEFSGRYSRRLKQINCSSEVPVTAYLEDNTNQKFRFHVKYVVSKNLEIKNRLEYVRYKQSDDVSNGYLFYQDFVLHPEEKSWSLAFRYALFQTDDYNSRIYAYERDVLYSFSMAPCYYKGSRVYLLYQQQIFNNLDVWVRWGSTMYTNKQTSGSGLTEIDKPVKSEIKVQIRYKF